MSNLEHLSAEQAQDMAESAPKGAEWKREDRPEYGRLGEQGHARLYGQWKAQREIDRPEMKGMIPEWHELGDSSRATWMASSSAGQPLIKAALRSLPKEEVGVSERKLTEDSSAPRQMQSYRRKTSEAKINSAVLGVALPTERHQEIFHKTGVVMSGAKHDFTFKSPSAPVTEDEIRLQGEYHDHPQYSLHRVMFPANPHAVSPDFSHHRAAEKLAADLSDQAQGRRTISRPLNDEATIIPSTESRAGAVRQPLTLRTKSDPRAVSPDGFSEIKNAHRQAQISLVTSAMYHSAGDRENAAAHFDNAIGHIQTLARKTHELQSARGESVGPQPAGVAAANVLNVKYKAHVNPESPAASTRQIGAATPSAETPRAAVARPAPSATKPAARNPFGR